MLKNNRLNGLLKTFIYLDSYSQGTNSPKMLEYFVCLLLELMDPLKMELA